MDHSVLYKRNMSALTRANNKSTTDQLNVQLDFFMQFSGAGFSAVETSAFGHVVGFRHLFFPAVAAFPPRPLSKKNRNQGRTERPLTLTRVESAWLAQPGCRLNQWRKCIVDKCLSSFLSQGKNKMFKNIWVLNYLWPARRNLTSVIPERSARPTTCLVL